MDMIVVDCRFGSFAASAAALCFAPEASAAAILSHCGCIHSIVVNRYESGNGTCAHYAIGGSMYFSVPRCETIQPLIFAPVAHDLKR
jgi:hypothetical protein